MSSQTNRPGVVTVDAVYLSDTQAAGEPAQCQVVEEAALTLDVEGVGYYTLMWTPTASASVAHGFTREDGLLGSVEQPEALALALGFACTEGLVDTIEDIRSLSVCEDNPSVVRVQLQAPELLQPSRRDVVINSSCSICGPREILEDNILSLDRVADSLQVRRSALFDLMAQMRDGQRIFAATGGSHAAAVFDADGRVLAVAEDLGRHNALDKVIGTVMLERGSVRGCGVVLSSRLSLELVLKAIRSGLEIMVAVSAPTSLAIEVAERFGVTLCGFVRDSRATIYSHSHRVC
jgi:FdhD protein